MIGKRGLSQGALVGLIIAIVVLAIGLGTVALLKGKGISAIDFIRDFIRGFGSGGVT